MSITTSVGRIKFSRKSKGRSTKNFKVSTYYLINYLLYFACFLSGSQRKEKLHGTWHLAILFYYCSNRLLNQKVQFPISLESLNLPQSEHNNTWINYVKWKSFENDVFQGSIIENRSQRMKTDTLTSHEYYTMNKCGGVD